MWSILWWMETRITHQKKNEDFTKEQFPLNDIIHLLLLGFMDPKRLRTNNTLFLRIENSQGFGTKLGGGNSVLPQVSPY